MRKTAALLAGAALLLASAGWAPLSADASTAHALIQGSGSTWASNAVIQWIADVRNQGLQVVFTGSGSAQGRKDFASKTVDFAVSDIGFQGTDPANGASDTSGGRAYAYLPIVAGGTALPYHIVKNGQLVRNLRLSGDTIAKIFTNKITNWDDPQITRDNNGNQMPNLPIVPVVHSEGSGSSYQFSRYLWKQYPQYWDNFNGNYATEYFPQHGAATSENGSDSLMNFISSTAANGAIGYDEYSYALGKNWPVVEVLNKGGYYTLPTQYNVAVALTQAQINYNKNSPDYLLQNLDNVYTYSDPRAYPISSYSYAIIPTSAQDPTMTTAKRQTLADYLFWSICQGQSEIGPIGYSSLPVNLVSASFQQADKLHQADSKVNLTNENVLSCHNPTFIAGHPDENCLAKIAPPPPPCDKNGAGPCAVDSNLNPTGKCVNLNTATGQGTGAKSHSGGSGSGGGGPSNPSGPSTGTSTGNNLVLPGGTSTGTNPLGGVGGTGQGGPGLQAAAVSTTEPRSQSPSLELGLEILAAALLLGLLIAPPLVAQRFKGK